ncbi:MAG: hypothetical protein ACYDCN_03020 [Bacteroidia bacterium]
MNYDTQLFLQIIEGQLTGLQPIRTDCRGTTHVCFYQGLNGNLVPIDTSDEEMYDETAKGHLIKLGLENLIPNLFPNTPITVPKTLTQLVPVDSINESHCTKCNGVGVLAKGEDTIPCEACEGTGNKT